jgi:hypothetical protein
VAREAAACTGIGVPWVWVRTVGIAGAAVGSLRKVSFRFVLPIPSAMVPSLVNTLSTPSLTFLPATAAAEPPAAATALSTIV